MGMERIYENLNFEAGEVVIPGVRKKIYTVSKADIANWPKLPTTGESMKSLATYDGDITLVAGKKWISIDTRTEEATISSDSQGEEPCKTFLNKGSFVHSGVEEDATAFARQANNDDSVYCVQTMGGKFRILGNEMWSTKTKVTQTLGASVTDKAGTSMEVEVSDVCPSPFYTGSLQLEDGTLDCSTNTFTPAGG